jgi:hypothetical protein
MRSTVRLSSIVFFAALCMFIVPMLAPGDNDDKHDKDIRPNGQGIGTREHPGNLGEAHSNAPGGGSTDNGIQYHGGSVLVNGVNVYLIWYGDWTGNSATTILKDLVNGMGGSSYFNINTTYYNGAGQHVQNVVKFGAETFDSYSLGKTLTDANIKTVVANAINSGAVAYNPDGVYFVLTSQDVAESSGFCKTYCGWHTHGTITPYNVRYAFIGNSDRCPTACEEQTTSSPNGNTGADGMASILAHELEEATTDPDLNAWYDRRGAENADKCAWTFGATYPAGNGSLANMILGSRNFLIQQNWLNASGGKCVLKY